MRVHRSLVGFVRRAAAIKARLAACHAASNSSRFLAWECPEILPVVNPSCRPLAERRGWLGQRGESQAHLASLARESAVRVGKSMRRVRRDGQASGGTDSLARAIRRENDRQQRGSAREFARRAERVGSLEWVSSTLDRLAKRATASARLSGKVSRTSKDEAALAARAAMLETLARGGMGNLGFHLYAHGQSDFSALLTIGRAAATDSLDDGAGMTGRSAGRRAAAAATGGGVSIDWVAGLMLEVGEDCAGRWERLRELAFSLKAWRSYALSVAYPPRRAASANRARRVSRLLLMVCAGESVEIARGRCGFSRQAVLCALQQSGVIPYLHGLRRRAVEIGGAAERIDWLRVRRVEIAERAERAERFGSLATLPVSPSLAQRQLAARLAPRASYIREWRRLLDAQARALSWVI